MLQKIKKKTCFK